MRAPLFVVALVGSALVLLAVAVHVLRDETLFVSSPEMTVSQLLHATSRRRIGVVREMLSREAQGATSDQDIQRVSATFDERVGRVQGTKAEALRRRGDTLLVQVAVEGERGDPELLVRLVREEGVWSAAQLGDVLPSGGAVTREGR